MIFALSRALFYRLFVVAFSALIWFTPLVIANAETNRVARIEIIGNDRVHDSSIRYYITSIEGKPYAPSNVRTDIKKLYKLGYFDDIQVDIKEEDEGYVLTYIFKEKPHINSIRVTGTKAVTRKDVKEVIKLEKGKHFKKIDALKDIESIKKLYREKGYYFVEVEVKEHMGSDNVVSLEYKIKEGKKIHIHAVRFSDNKEFKDEMLSKVIDTAPKDILSYITESGTYKKDVLKTDLLKIESFYRNNGYIKVRVEDPKVEIDKEMGRIYVDFFVNEGSQYKVGKIEIEGDEVYSESKIREVFSLKEGDVFDRSKFARDIFSVTDLYLIKGYAFVDVIKQTDIDEEKKLVNVRINVERGDRVYIGKITITGNETTRDKVIRREFRLSEGSLFDSSKLVRSRERLNRLGFFENVDIKQKSRVEDDLIDLDIEVAETSTGQLSVGAGYSSVEKAIFFAQISKRNLFGRGQKLSLDAQLSAVKTNYSLSFTEPWMFDREFSTGFSIFNTVREYTAFTSSKKGGSISLGKAFGEYVNGNASYRYSVDSADRDNTDEISEYIKSQLGQNITSSITPSLSRDTRDDFFNPGKGSKTSLNGTYAGGVLGGRSFYRINMEYSYYHTLPLSVIFMGHTKAGYARGHSGDELPLYENYFMGGSTSLRGFNFKDVGPREVIRRRVTQSYYSDTPTPYLPSKIIEEVGDAQGGNTSLLFNIEFQYPFSKFVRVFVFYDRGQIYGSEGNQDKTSPNYFDLSNMRHSWGVGVKFVSPVGPISLTWGWKLDKYEDENPMEFHFDIGTAF